MKAALLLLIVAGASAQIAPIVHLTSEPTPTNTNTPVVLMHGMGDSGSNPGMQSIAKTISYVAIVCVVFSTRLA